VAPFAGLDEVMLGLGERCLRVVVADTGPERAQGLAGIDSIEPYAGMLFVFDADNTTTFTMRSTRLALDIGWYAASGTLVDRAEMVPCPDGDCDSYASDRPYRYALEMPGGGPTGGAISACA
jgi:uncharacterized membrane protein (UPF0127 family)